MPNKKGGRGQGRSGKGQGKGGGRCGRGGMGSNGVCMCPNCGTKGPHQPGVPCIQIKCPNCGTQMVRG